MTGNFQKFSNKALKVKEAMKEFIENKCFLTGDFELSTGIKSNFYFDCKKATLNGYFLHLLTEYILDEIIPTLPEQPCSVGGLTLGADFMTAALALKSYEKGLKMKQGSIIRKEPKKHGTRNCIENELTDDEKTILVMDDVITSGKSIEKACGEFKQAGYKIIALLTIVDRETGDLEHLKNKFDVPVLHIFTKSDFSRRFII